MLLLPVALTPQLREDQQRACQRSAVLYNKALGYLVMQA